MNRLLQEYPTPAKRPYNSRLDCSKITKVFGIEPDNWQESLGEMLDEMKGVLNVKILVTGGAGFIGSAVVRHLIDDTQHQVVNIDKLTYAKI